MPEKTSKLPGLIKRLAFVPENVLEEAAEQPGLFYEVSKIRVAKMRKKSLATAEYEAHKASMALRLRAKASTSGERTTEHSLAERVGTMTSTMALREAMDVADAEETLLKLLLEAYRMRRDGIRVIADSKIYREVNEDSETNRIQRKLAEKARRLEDQRQRLQGSEQEEEDD